RLPRLVGVEKAIEMLVSARSIGAADALAAGLIDRVVDGVDERDSTSGRSHATLEEPACSFAREILERAAAPLRTRDRVAKPGTIEAAGPFLEAGRELASKTRRNQRAPLAAVEAIAAAVERPFAEGCARERELVGECVHSDQCRALLHLFFAERA